MPAKKKMPQKPPMMGAARTGVGGTIPGRQTAQGSVMATAKTVRNANETARKTNEGARAGARSAEVRKFLKKYGEGAQ